MKIRKADIEDLDSMMEIYARARAFMKENGNPQWGDTYPERSRIEKEIRQEKMYLCMEGEKIACVFYFAQEEEEAYKVIEGAWLNEKPYGVVHRVASSGIVRGAARYCLQWAYEQCGNIRMDTYKENLPMQSLLGKCGFRYCGRFYQDGRDWMAYQKAQKN